MEQLTSDDDPAAAQVMDGPSLDEILDEVAPLAPRTWQSAAKLLQDSKGKGGKGKGKKVKSGKGSKLRKLKRNVKTLKGKKLKGGKAAKHPTPADPPPAESILEEDAALKIAIAESKATADSLVAASAKLDEALNK
eukprot:8812347-Heterocapsa_arctica.AAC.1